MMVRSFLRRGACALALSWVLTHTAMAAVTFRLSDHPDGAMRPPTYGLRLDGLVGGDSNDEFTFTFNHSEAELYLTLDQDASTVRIYGTVYGGRDSGSSYDPGLVGTWEVDFLYDTSLAVSAGGDGKTNDITVLPGAGNTGTLTFLSGAGLSPGTQFNLVDEAGSNAFSFKFNDEENHRYAGAPAGTFVGWGWLNHAPAPETPQGHIYDSDWLFTGTQVPEPASCLIWSTLAVLGAFRYRGRSALKREATAASKAG